MVTLRQILILTSVAILISVASIAVYDRYFKEEKVVIMQAPRTTAIQANDILMSGEIQRYFQSSAPTDFIHAASTAAPAVVYIRANNSGLSSLRGQSNAAGSGVIISPDGFVATNNHVIENGNDIVVVLNDRREFSAKIVGTDPTTDLALLKIEADNLPYLIFGNSDSLQVGEWVLAVGNPFRLQSTVTAGIVSAKGRNINILDTQYGIESFIQTDAAVNPGNSGGALVNTNGELVGINTAIITYSGRYEGYSFAIPSNLAMKVLYDLMEFGSVHRGLLGIQATSVNAEMASELNLESPNGVFIQRITSGSGAEEAGLKRGDVIISIDNRSVNTLPELLETLGRYRPGDKVEVGFIREGEIKNTVSVLKNQLNTTDLISVRRDKVLTDLGFEVRDLLPAEKRRIEVEGVKVISIYRSSTIARTRMEPGYIITKMNEIPIKNAEQLISLLSETRGRIFFEGYYEQHGGPWWYAFHR
ncbi:MAG: PDZ domain-containing protein [Saprospirales bacterium]|nr:MAG: PDZ domain-containing protein [Saprospirales bacterium]